MNRRLELEVYRQPLFLRQVAIPEPPANGAVVKIHFSGICHTDVQYIDEGTETPAAKVMGHEISGEIYSLGTDVIKNGARLRVGDHVILFPWLGCGECPQCRSGENQLCFGRVKFAHGCLHVDGGYQDYVIVERLSCLHLVPEGLPMDLGAIITCSGVTAYSGVSSITDGVHRCIKIYGSATVLIMGAGGLGLWGVELAKLILPKETTVAVMDISADKFLAAKEAGADKCVLWDINESPEKNAANIKQTLGSLHAAVDFVGKAVTSSAIFGCLDKGGKMVIVGMMDYEMMEVDSFKVTSNETSLTGAVVGNQSKLDEILKMAAERKIKGPPISHVTMEEANQAIMELRQGRRVGRTVIAHDL